MNEIQIFKNEEFGEIRVIEIDSEAWFVGKDVAERLGYSNASKAVIVHVDDEDKRFEMMKISDSQNGNLVKTAFINESGLYSLVLSSKLPSAKKFKRWITKDVLPSIRKHGAYMTEQTIKKALASPDFLIQLATKLKEEQERNKELKKQNDVLLEDNERMKPKEVFADAVAASKTSILVGELAKILKQNGFDVGAIRLFEILRNEGYLIKRRGSDWNMPTQYSMELGLMEIKETTSVNPDGSVRTNKTPKVTGKGQEYFINKFLKKGNEQDESRQMNLFDGD